METIFFVALIVGMFIVGFFSISPKKHPITAVSYLISFLLLLWMFYTINGNKLGWTVVVITGSYIVIVSLFNRYIDRRIDNAIKKAEERKKEKV